MMTTQGWYTFVPVRVDYGSDVFYESETQFHSHKCKNVFTTQFQGLHLKLCLHAVFKPVPKLVSIETDLATGLRIGS